MTGKKKNPLIENPMPYHSSVTAKHLGYPFCNRKNCLLTRCFGVCTEGLNSHMCTRLLSAWYRPAIKENINYTFRSFATTGFNSSSSKTEPDQVHTITKNRHCLAHMKLCGPEQPILLVFTIGNLVESINVETFMKNALRNLTVILNLLKSWD